MDPLIYLRNLHKFHFHTYVGNTRMSEKCLMFAIFVLNIHKTYIHVWSQIHTHTSTFAITHISFDDMNISNISIWYATYGHRHIHTHIKHVLVWVHNAHTYINSWHRYIQKAHVSMVIQTFMCPRYIYKQMDRTIHTRTYIHT